MRARSRCLCSANLRALALLIERPVARSIIWPAIVPQFRSDEENSRLKDQGKVLQDSIGLASPSAPR